MSERNGVARRVDNTGSERSNVRRRQEDLLNEDRRLRRREEEKLTERGSRRLSETKYRDDDSWERSSRTSDRSDKNYHQDPAWVKQVDKKRDRLAVDSESERMTRSAATKKQDRLQEPPNTKDGRKNAPSPTKSVETTSSLISSASGEGKATSNKDRVFSDTGQRRRATFDSKREQAVSKEPEPPATGDPDNGETEEDMKPLGPIPTEEWECRHCTYVNPPGIRVCEVCCKTRTLADESTGDEEAVDLRLAEPEVLAEPRTEPVRHEPVLAEQQTEPLVAPSNGAPSKKPVNLSSKGTSPPPQSISTQTYDVAGLGVKKISPEMGWSSPRRSFSRQSVVSDTAQSGASPPRSRSPGDTDSQATDPRQPRRTELPSTLSRKVAKGSWVSSQQGNSMVQKQVSQGLEMVKLLREAEEVGFSGEEVSVAVEHCGDGSPLQWLLENWTHMIDTVVTLATNYGHERKENTIGTVSEREARAALITHQGSVWSAVTQVVQERQNKYGELLSRGNFSREDIVTALTAHRGDLEAAYTELTKGEEEEARLELDPSGRVQTWLTQHVYQSLPRLRQPAAKQFPVTRRRSDVHRFLDEVLSAQAGPPVFGETRYGSLHSLASKATARAPPAGEFGAPPERYTSCLNLHEASTRLDLTTPHLYAKQRPVYPSRTSNNPRNVRTVERRISVPDHLQEFKEKLLYDRQVSAPIDHLEEFKEKFLYDRQVSAPVDCSLADRLEPSISQAGKWRNTDLSTDVSSPLRSDSQTDGRSEYYEDSKSEEVVQDEEEDVEQAQEQVYNGRLQLLIQRNHKRKRRSRRSIKGFHSRFSIKSDPKHELKSNREEASTAKQALGSRARNKATTQDCAPLSRPKKESTDEYESAETSEEEETANRIPAQESNTILRKPAPKNERIIVVEREVSDSEEKVTAAVPSEIEQDAKISELPSDKDSASKSHSDELREGDYREPEGSVSNSIPFIDDDLFSDASEDVALKPKAKGFRQERKTYTAGEASKSDDSSRYLSPGDLSDSEKRAAVPAQTSATSSSVGARNKQGPSTRDSGGGRPINQKNAPTLPANKHGKAAVKNAVEREEIVSTKEKFAMSVEQRPGSEYEEGSDEEAYDYVQDYAAQDNIEQKNVVQDNSSQDSAVQDNAAQDNNQQENAVQDNSSQVSAVQDNAAQDNDQQKNAVQDKTQSTPIMPNVSTKANERSASHILEHQVTNEDLKALKAESGKNALKRIEGKTPGSSADETNQKPKMISEEVSVQISPVEIQRVMDSDKVEINSCNEEVSRSKNGTKGEFVIAPEMTEPSEKEELADMKEEPTEPKRVSVTEKNILKELVQPKNPKKEPKMENEALSSEQSKDDGELNRPKDANLEKKKVSFDDGGKVSPPAPQGFQDEPIRSVHIEIVEVADKGASDHKSDEKTEPRTEGSSEDVSRLTAFASSDLKTKIRLEPNRLLPVVDVDESSDKDVSPIPTDSEGDKSRSPTKSKGDEDKEALPNKREEMVTLIKESLSKDVVLDRLVGTILGVLQGGGSSDLLREQDLRLLLSEDTKAVTEVPVTDEGMVSAIQLVQDINLSPKQALHQTILHCDAVKTTTEPIKDEIQTKNEEFQREVRRILAEGLVTSYHQAELVANLVQLKFPAHDAVQAANECTSLQAAISFLHQECPLCANKCTIKEMVGMLECDHRCCKECAYNYFNLQVTEASVWDCVCPFCRSPDLKTSTQDQAQLYFSHLDILLKGILPEATHELFQRKLRDWTLAQDPNFKWCTKCSSGFIANPHQKVLMCPDCRSVTCARCRKPWEGGHEASCEEASSQAEPETLLNKHLEEEGITCPSCKARYSLARGGCMHMTCTSCKHEFCSGCAKPFLMGDRCHVSEYCMKLGLHAHHPRNCLFYLRDKEPQALEQLLQEHKVELRREGVEEGSGGKCKVRLLKETDDGLQESECSHSVHAQALCRTHYVEHLVRLVKVRKLDPATIMDLTEAQQELRRRGKQLPERLPRQCDQSYRLALIKIVQEEIPLE